MGSETALPTWLADYESFSGHLDEQLADENPHGRGLRFVNFALALLPRIPRCDEFSDFQLNDKLSHDKGVDILAASNEIGQRLYVQSKFRLRRVSEVDEILSQFEAYELESSGQASEQGTLFSSLELENKPKPIYAIVTSSKMDGIMDRYRGTRRSSRAFYDSLVTEDRLLILEGPTILLALQSVYRKSFEVPSLLEIRGATGWLNAESVYVGILSGVELLHLYDEHGDGLFFENIRSFLGLEKNHDRESVNRKIAKTVEETPEKMLERNNGITIRANRVRRVGKQLILENASIVNGCQTTMCIVARREFVNEALLIPVKIVESADLWEVAHSANYQNRVRQIDLDLAKYLRPQLVQREAARSGLSVAPDAAHGVTDMIAAISDVQITYEETKALYKGVFSERPTNIFDNNYSKLLAPVLEVIYEHQDTSDSVFSSLFSISSAARMGRNDVSEIHAETETRYFQRFRKPEYSAYIALLAAGVVTGVNLADREQDPADEAGRLISFLDSAAEAAENRSEEFSEAYVYAYEILSETGLSSITQQSGDALVSQDLHKKIVNTPYETYFETLKMRIRRERARRARKR